MRGMDRKVCLGKPGIDGQPIKKLQIVFRGCLGYTLHYVETLIISLILFSLLHDSLISTFNFLSTLRTTCIPSRVYQ